MTSRLPPRGDLALGAVGVALTALIATAVSVRGLTWYTGLDLLIHAGLCAALIVRRVYRRSSFVATYALLAALAVVVALAPINLGVSPIILTAPLALYVVARHEPGIWGVAGLLLGIAGTFVSPVNRLAGGPGLLVPVMILGMVGTYLWASGRRRTELAYADRLARERAQHERELASRVVRAQLDERVRIAREVHDVIAHSLAVVSVQANTGLAIGTPEQLRTSLTGVQEASRAALAELRALLDVLRDDRVVLDVNGDLLRLHDLATAALDAGVRLSVALPDDATLRGWQDAWPANVRLAVVRVVQESLSNVIKHGGPNPRATLRVGVEAGECVVRIVNERPPRSGSPLTLPDSLPGGVGLLGLRERVTLVGGQFRAGDGPTGFQVEARLPIGPSQDAEVPGDEP